MNLSSAQLKKILVGSGFVGESDFDLATKASKELNLSIPDILIFRGIISEQALGQLIAEALKVPFVTIGQQIIHLEVLQLIPEKERVKNKITLKTILAIEHYYSCSRNALLNRLYNMKLIDRGKIDENNKDIIKNATLYGYNTDLYQPGNEGMIIGDYGSLARELFDLGIISESSYFTLLEDIGIDLSQLDHLNTNEQVC